MVFPSIPDYLDPSNWQQASSHQNHRVGLNPQLLPPPAVAGGGSMGWMRPGSSADRARLSNIPMPQVPLNCPRCDSMNTKFCYFNNYSLSQPRHFCKTCRRYWTRGGALRRVPVGGGSRRNKRGIAATAVAAKAALDRQTTTLFATAMSSTTERTTSMLGFPPQFQQLRFMAPLSQPTEYGSASHETGFNFNRLAAAGPVLPAANEMNITAGANFLGELATLLASYGGGDLDPWRLHPTQPNFPFLGFDQPPPPGVFLFPNEVELPSNGGEQSSLAQPNNSSSQMLTSLSSSLKVEENNTEEPNMTVRLMGIPGSDQWGGSSIAWTDLSNFPTSSNTNPHIS